MRKKLIYILLLFVICIFLTACNKQKTIILLNNNPITKDNLLDNANLFSINKRIYYIFISQKPIKSEFIRVRVIKRDGEGGYKIPVTLLYSNDFRLKKEEVYYYTNYFVIHDPGEFFMSVYELNDLRRPLSTTNFRVKN